MGNESAQIFNVVVLTIAVLLQTIFLIGIALSVAKMRRSVEQFTADIHRFLESASRSVDILNSNMTQINQRVQRRLQQAESISDEVLARSRVHALTIDGLIGEILHTAEYASHELWRITRGSFREVRALNAGLRAGLELLYKRRRSRPW